MTDKELRRLSRLELLELLLDAGKENERLKSEIEKLKIENKTAQNIENLSTASSRIENALKYAQSLTGFLKSSPAEPVKTDASEEGCLCAAPEAALPEPVFVSDRELYRRMMSYFANNDEGLGVFPQDIEIAVRSRIRMLLEGKK